MSLDPLDLALPRDPEQLAGFRATLGDWPDRAGVDDHDRDEIVLAAHEAVANGIEHSHGDGESDPVDVDGATDDLVAKPFNDLCGARESVVVLGRDQYLQAMWWLRHPTRWRLAGQLGKV